MWQPPAWRLTWRNGLAAFSEQVRNVDCTYPSLEACCCRGLALLSWQRAMMLRLVHILVLYS